MFNLPEKTALRKIIPKKHIYEAFSDDFTAEKKKLFDEDIKSITVVNEISPQSINIAETEQIGAIFVVEISLKKPDFQEKNIISIAKLFNQNMIFSLKFKDNFVPAVYMKNGTFLQGAWRKELSLELNGLNLDEVWDNFIIQIGDIQLEGNNSVEEQVAIDNKRQELTVKIEVLKRRIYKEKQARRKYDLNKELKQLIAELE